MIKSLPQNSPEFNRRLLAGAVVVASMAGGIATFATVFNSGQDSDRRVAERSDELFKCSRDVYRYAGRPDVVTTIPTNVVPRNVQENCDSVLIESGGNTIIPTSFQVFGLATVESVKVKSDSEVADVAIAGTLGFIGALFAGLLPGAIYDKKYGKKPAKS